MRAGGGASPAIYRVNYGYLVEVHPNDVTFMFWIAPKEYVYAKPETGPLGNTVRQTEVAFPFKIRLFVSGRPDHIRACAKVALAWEPPIIDGGATIFEYEVWV